jgi:flagellar basal-body rod modification protein FlgD
MAISGIDSQYNSSQQSSLQKIMSKDDFLKLFVMQLRYQNPLNPMDNTEFTAQLAQFSSLEQLQNMNTQMNNLVLSQSSLQNTMLSDLIGKKVKISGNEEYGTVTGITFEDNLTYLVIDGTYKTQLSEIKEIKGGE